MLRLLIATSILISATPVIAGENCTCRYQEADVNEGQTICMRTPNGMQMATCARVLNNTSWKFLGLPCPSAELKQEQKASDIDLEKAKALLAKHG